jgi:hypothetical protein
MFGVYAAPSYRKTHGNPPFPLCFALGGAMWAPNRRFPARPTPGDKDKSWSFHFGPGGIHCSVNYFRFLVFVALVCPWFRGPPGGLRGPREGPRIALGASRGPRTPRARVKKPKNLYFCRARLSGREEVTGDRRSERATPSGPGDSQRFR